MAHMTIGEFAGRTRLSPKALRIYADLGLVAPAAVDPATGYRRYDESQVERARMVALLRRLDMPLAEIARVIDLDPDGAVDALAGWWQQAEQEMAWRRELVGYLQSRFKGTQEEFAMRDVSLRSVPERMVASISRHVTASEVDAFFDDAFSRLRAFGAGLEGISGAPFVVYYGEVSQDSDGPVELCRPVALDTAPGAAPAIQDIQVRVDPAHDEAYIRLTPAEASWPAMLPAIDALEHWGRDNDRTPRGPLRQVFIADMRTAGPDTLVCDLSIPLR